MYEPTYYGPTMVLNITEYDYDGDKDTDLFIVYDFDEDLFYVYGHRGSTKSKHDSYMRSFSCVRAMHEFISLTCCFEEMKSISIAVNQLDGLTSDSDYFEFKRKVNKRNEVVAYDNMPTIGPKKLCKWLRAYLI